VDEGEDVPPELAGREALAVSAPWEAELAGLAGEEAASMRGELGLAEGALDAVVGAAYRLLDLVTFFTAVGGTEARARSLPRGGTALDAAGKVHTDMREGFVRAEVVTWEDLVACGSFSQAREAAKLRIEGRDYVVNDGDVLTIRHTPQRKGRS
jgi:ribosome-binding ATPase YchF (GTP1/OBG family)